MIGGDRYQGLATEDVATEQLALERRQGVGECVNLCTHERVTASVVSHLELVNNRDSMCPGWSSRPTDTTGDTIT